MKSMYIAAALVLGTATLAAQANPIPKKTPEKQIVSTAPAKSKIDLNTADVSLLIGSFKGIGKKRAEAIIAYRDSHQGFKSIQELAEVKGIGQHFMTVNQEKLHEIFVIK